jgi:hypothetical protein
MDQVREQLGDDEDHDRLIEEFQRQREMAV